MEPEQVEPGLGTGAAVGWGVGGGRRRMSRLRTIRILQWERGPGRGAGAAAPGSRAEHRAVRMSSTSGLPAGSLTSEGGDGGGSLQMAPALLLRERLHNQLTTVTS